MRTPDFWRHEGGVLGPLLAPLGWCYGLGTRLRLVATQPWKASVPVLCVGNVVAGGAGKTPVALSLGGQLRERGLHVHYLGRGHGGRAVGPLEVDPAKHDAGDVGDEALLLARAGPTWVSRDRAAGARAAAEGADVIVMDDGFQNPSLAKDLSLVVVDGGYGFGNNRIIPAGPLRESVGAALARADALVVIGDGAEGIKGHAEVRRRGLPVLEARIVPGPEAEGLSGMAVVAFAGIARPEKFFATLEEIGCQVTAAHAFPDHHGFSTAEIERLKREAEELGATPVTTAKDAVRLSEADRDGVTVLTISLEWVDEVSLDSVLSPLFRG
ncbi:MAG: tetraacyldisaccharide 4'-kinase [Rhodospirillales bacterium]